MAQLYLYFEYLDVYKRQDSRPIDFGEDRLRERGSLPATFYVLTRVKYLVLINKVS